MGRIRVLSDNVANKIAAGEVVERPASVIKELLENSLDAGATSIRIAVEHGGRRLIRIADDGAGMLHDDALLAFERHATSKLHDVKDLLSIATLGFRGEALPSIASVSRLVLETRTAEETTGTRVEIAGGKILTCDEIAAPPGTTITVRDLFFNVPARKKFLRTEQTELSHIASLVTHYSLAHPDKTFELTSESAELLHATPVETLRERVFQVFGSTVLDDLVDLGERSRSLLLPQSPVPATQAISEWQREPEDPPASFFSLRGFVSRPQVQKNNRNSIYVFVNGRLIRDRLILHAISSAYHNLIPPSCFPFALLFLTCDPGEVDVNVHPSKTEVRFRHGPFTHDFIRDAIREVLMESRPAPSFSPIPHAANAAGELSDLPPVGWSELPPSAPPEPTFQVAPDDGRALPVFHLQPSAGVPTRLPFGDTAIALAEQAVLTPAKSKTLRVPDTHGAFPDFGTATGVTSLNKLADLKPLGQIHDSFIIASSSDGLWIIDQHVAHERILFEKVLTQRASGRVEVQQLLIPLVIQLTPEQQIEFARIAGELEALGFEVEPFGIRTVAVKAAPAAIPQADLDKVLFEVLEIAEDELRNVSLDDLRRGIAASIACQAAIKINTPLDQNKMEWLLRALAATSYPMACPHGRPIALQYATRDILKAFHRI